MLSSAHALQRNERLTLRTCLPHPLCVFVSSSQGAYFSQSLEKVGSISGADFSDALMREDVQRKLCDRADATGKSATYFRPPWRLLDLYRVQLWALSDIVLCVALIFRDEPQDQGHHEGLAALRIGSSDAVTRSPYDSIDSEEAGPFVSGGILISQYQGTYFTCLGRVFLSWKHTMKTVRPFPPHLDACICCRAKGGANHSHL